MDNPHYNRIKATSKRAQNDARISSAEREQARPKVKEVLAENDKREHSFLNSINNH